MPDKWKVENYSVYLKGAEPIRVISDVDMHIAHGEIVGLIGESGCGKSVFWKSILGLMDSGRWSNEGNVWLNGRQIDLADKNSLRKIRGKEAAVILQDPMSSFDQVFTIERHFLETAKAHTKWSKKETEELAVRLLKRLYIREPERVLRMYPFQCSGGMLQRIMIAISLMLEPAVLIADEPTTSVDVTVQREIITMLKELNESRQTSILYISHDLRAVESIADRVYVMYAGYLVESFPVSCLREKAVSHPYTKKLLEARPSFTKGRLPVIAGSPPTLLERRKGCPFAQRCPEADENCLNFDMKNACLAENHMIRCLKRGVCR